MSISETAKDGYLPKGLTHGFGKKIQYFLIFFLSKIGLEIMLSYGLERKEGFEDDENVNFLKCKKWIFAKGVNPWFRSKNPQFFVVCFSAK